MPSTKSKKRSTTPQEELPPFHWSSFFPKAQVLYITDVDIANSEILKIEALPPLAVGFDLEWKPRADDHPGPGPVALVQIGFEQRILLFHISQMPGTVAETLPLRNQLALS